VYIVLRSLSNPDALDSRLDTDRSASCSRNADWMLGGVPPHYQQFLFPVYWFIVHTLPGSGSTFREHYCKSDFKSHALFVARAFNDFFSVNNNAFVLHFAGRL